MLKKNINVYRRYALAGATFSVAISIGFLMQSSEPSYAGHSGGQAMMSAELPQGIQPASLVQEEPVLDAGELMKTLPELPQEASLNTDLPNEPVVLIVSRDLPVGALPLEEAAPKLACEVTLKAEPVAAAMVDLTLMAPCLSGERVTFQHSGMTFTEVLGDDGSLNVTVPALSQSAMFVVAFTNGEGAIARAEVGSLEFYDRAAVQWVGEADLQLHALEHGANYGEEGHVWKDEPRDVSVIAGGQGGFLTRLGNPDLAEPKVAEVYTFPTASAQGEGVVALSVEAEVSEVNCAKDVQAKTFQVWGDSEPVIRDVSLTLPDCEAAGEFLVLKNLLEDLKLATR